MAADRQRANCIKMLRIPLVFITGRGGAGRGCFSHARPRPYSGPGRVFSGNPRPAPVRGPAGLFPCTGPRLLPPMFNRDPCGIWVGRGLERGQGQGMPKKTPRPRPLSRAGRGKGPGSRVFRGPVRPVTNSTYPIQRSTWGPGPTESVPNRGKYLNSRFARGRRAPIKSHLIQPATEESNNRRSILLATRHREYWQQLASPRIPILKSAGTGT